MTVWAINGLLLACARRETEGDFISVSDAHALVPLLLRTESAS